MCEHEFERLRHQAEQQSFNSQILGEIEEAKRKLERKIVNLRIAGNYHEVARTEKLVAFLNWTEESVRRMLNDQGGKKGGLIE